MENPRLTKEQQERLAKLEVELEAKRIYEETSKTRRMAASKRTGIPYDIVDTDVVRLGTMLGLIRNLGDEKEPDDISILDLLLGTSSSGPVYSYNGIPSYFSMAPCRIEESMRVEKHQEFVKKKCNIYWSAVSAFLSEENGRVEKVVSLSIPNMTPEVFVSAVKENMDVVLEMITESDDEQPDLYEQLKVLRNSLASFIPICEYRNILVEHMRKIHRKNIQDLSYIDASLILYPGFDQLESDNELAVFRSLCVRSHTKDPKLAPLDMATIVKECCTPALMFVNLEHVLRNSIVGPYANNAVGHMTSTKNFYVLKCISGNVRLWIHDECLRDFSQKLKGGLLAYVNKTLDTIRRASDKRPPIEVRLMDTLAILKKPAVFRRLICSIVSETSVIFPTEADAFDFIQ